MHAEAAAAAAAAGELTPRRRALHRELAMSGAAASGFSAPPSAGSAFEDAAGLGGAAPAAPGFEIAERLLRAEMTGNFGADAARAQADAARADADTLAELHALLQCAAAVIDGAARLDDDWVMCRALAAGPDFNARLAHVRPARVPAKRVKACLLYTSPSPRDRG